MGMGFSVRIGSHISAGADGTITKMSRRFKIMDVDCGLGRYHGLGEESIDIITLGKRIVMRAGAQEAGLNQVGLAVNELGPCWSA